MNKSKPPLNWLRAFEASARLGSITLAANELNITQSAVSQQIRALETQLKTQLFVRAKRSIGLSDQGRQLLPQIAAGLLQIEEALQNFGSDILQDELVILASNSVIYNVIAPKLHQFFAAFPQANLRFSGNIWADEKIGRICDIEIRFWGQAERGTMQYLFAPNELIVIAPKNSGPLAWEDLMRARRIETIGSLDRWSDLAAICSKPKPSAAQIEVDHYGAAIELVKNGVGIALVNRGIAQRAIDSGEVERLGEYVLPAKSGYISRVMRRKSPLADEFHNWLCAL